MRLCSPIIMGVAHWEHSILERGELADPFDRHRGPTDVSHFFTLPLLSQRNTVIFAKKYPETDRPLPRTHDHVPFHERMFRRPIVPFRGVRKMLLRTARKHRSCLSFSSFQFSNKSLRMLHISYYVNKFSHKYTLLH